MLPYCIFDGGGIEVAFIVEFLLLTVFDEAVRNSETRYGSRIVVVDHEFSHSTAKTAHDAGIFYSDNFFVMRKNFVKKFCVQRFYKTQIIMRRKKSFLF